MCGLLRIYERYNLLHIFSKMSFKETFRNLVCTTFLCFSCSYLSTDTIATKNRDKKLTRENSSNNNKTMKSVLLILVSFAAATSKMTLMERITWQENDPKGEIMAKHYIKSHFDFCYVYFTN